VSVLIVVGRPERWPIDIPGVRVVSSRRYLTDAGLSELRATRVFNLCRSYSYQSLGYYVSLLAEARGHRPLPSVETIQDLKSQGTVRVVSEDLAELVRRSLAPVRTGEYVLSIYFGRPLAQRHRRLALALFNQFQAPLLRARFRRDDDVGWQLVGIRPIPASEVPRSHHDSVVEAAGEYFRGRRRAPRRSPDARFDLAILHDPAEELPPSDPVALKRMVRAAAEVGLSAELVTRDDAGRLAEFDALFLRTTTAVEHYTYRLSSRAQAMGLVVVDDPQSIVRAANKVFLAEVLGRHGVPIPETRVVHRDNVGRVAGELGLPCVLKQPDSAFSQGVHKVATRAALEEALARLLEESELVVAQSFVPTDFDWRIGVFAGRPLWACRYFMARHHWQIIRHGETRAAFGRVEALPVEDVPRHVLRHAVRAARLIGDGLYGVDLKQRGRRSVVIEVNDNPNLDAGLEDRVLGRELYRRIMLEFLRRIERLRAPQSRRARA